MERDFSMNQHKVHFCVVIWPDARCISRACDGYTQEWHVKNRSEGSDVKQEREETAVGWHGHLGARWQA